MRNIAHMHVWGHVDMVLPGLFDDQRVGPESLWNLTYCY